MGNYNTGTIISSIESFVKQPSIDSTLQKLRSKLPENAEIFIAGGALRNIVMQTVLGRSPITHDIDIFIGGIPADYSLEQLVPDQDYESTILGGIRWTPNSSAYVYDLSVLANFVILTEYNLEPTIENFLVTIDFDVNTGIWDTLKEEFHERGCIGAVEKRLIGFNSTRFIDKILTAYRIFRIQYRTGFMVSEPIYKFIKDQVDLETLIKLKSIFKKRLGKQDTKKIMSIYDYLSSFRDYDSYAADMKARLISE